MQRPPTHACLCHCYKASAWLEGAPWRWHVAPAHLQTAAGRASAAGRQAQGPRDGGGARGRARSIARINLAGTSLCLCTLHICVMLRISCTVQHAAQYGAQPAGACNRTIADGCAAHMRGCCARAAGCAPSNNTSCCLNSCRSSAGGPYIQCGRVLQPVDAQDGRTGRVTGWLAAGCAIRWPLGWPN
jgi:hypothetical protein